jgi:hypothetical protein
MNVIPWDIPKPLMSLDIFCIVGVHAEACVILITSGRRGMVFASITFRAQSMLLLLNYTANEILASSAHSWFGGKGKSTFVTLRKVSKGSQLRAQT